MVEKAEDAIGTVFFGFLPVPFDPIVFNLSNDFICKRDISVLR